MTPGLPPALGGLRQRRWNPTHWAVSHFRPGIPTDSVSQPSVPQAAPTVATRVTLAPCQQARVPEPSGLHRPDLRGKTLPKGNQGRRTRASPRLAPAPARSTRSAQRPPGARAARLLTQKMRLRKTSTVLEEVMPHWPMVPAEARLGERSGAALTERAGNGGGGSAEKCWA